MEIITMTRQQLYDLVWSKSMRDAASTIPMSDRGLKKVCLRYAVPVPPQGYWNKLQAGHRVKRIPLPPPISDEMNAVVIGERGVDVIERNKLERLRRTAPKTREELAERQKHERAAFGSSRKQRASSHQLSRTATPRQKARQVTMVRYVLPIGRWRWTYSFGINENETSSQHRYVDGRSLTLNGRLKSPSKIAGSPVRLALFAFKIRNDAQRDQNGSEFVGSLWEDETQQYGGFLKIEQDVLATLVPMLLADKLRYVVFSGEALRDGQADIYNYRIEAAVDESPTEE